MWQYWRKDPLKKRVNEIRLKDKLLFGFDKADEWEITQVSFEHDGYGSIGQMLICIERVDKANELTHNGAYTIQAESETVSYKNGENQF